MRTALLLTFSVLAATAAACDRSTAPTTTETRPAPLAVLGSPTPTASPATYRECRGGVHGPTTGRGFEHKRSHLVAAATPNHSVQDFFAAPGTPVTLSAKLAYGDIGKDLEDEPVEIMLDDCSALAVRGTAKTDDDGLAAHGNATTDVWAYAQAGIPANVSYIIGPHAGAEGTIAVRDDWSSVAEVARAHRPASQPFVRP